MNTYNDMTVPYMLLQPGMPDPQGYTVACSHPDDGDAVIGLCIGVTRSLEGKVTRLRINGFDEESQGPFTEIVFNPCFVRVINQSYRYEADEVFAHHRKDTMYEVITMVNMRHPSDRFPRGVVFDEVDRDYDSPYHKSLDRFRATMLLPKDVQ